MAIREEIRGAADEPPTVAATRALVLVSFIHIVASTPRGLTASTPRRAAAPRVGAVARRFAGGAGALQLRAALQGLPRGTCRLGASHAVRGRRGCQGVLPPSSVLSRAECVAKPIGADGRACRATRRPVGVVITLVARICWCLGRRAGRGISLGSFGRRPADARRALIVFLRRALSDRLVSERSRSGRTQYKAYVLVQCLRAELP